MCAPATALCPMVMTDCCTTDLAMLQGTRGCPLPLGHCRPPRSPSLWNTCAFPFTLTHPPSATQHTPSLTHITVSTIVYHTLNTPMQQQYTLDASRHLHDCVDRKYPTSVLCLSPMYHTSTSNYQEHFSVHRSIRVYQVKSMHGQYLARQLRQSQQAHHMVPSATDAGRFRQPACVRRCDEPVRRVSQPQAWTGGQMMVARLCERVRQGVFGPGGRATGVHDVLRR